MPTTNPWLLHVAAVRKAHPELKKDVVAVIKLAKKTYTPAKPTTPVKTVKPVKPVKSVKPSRSKKSTILGTIRKVLRMKGGLTPEQQYENQMKGFGSSPASGGGKHRRKSSKRSSLFSSMKKLVSGGSPVENKKKVKKVNRLNSLEAKLKQAMKNPVTQQQGFAQAKEHNTRKVKLTKRIKGLKSKLGM